MSKLSQNKISIFRRIVLPSCLWPKKKKFFFLNFFFWGGGGGGGGFYFYLFIYFFQNDLIMNWLVMGYYYIQDVY